MDYESISQRATTIMIILIIIINILSVAFYFFLNKIKFLSPPLYKYLKFVLSSYPLSIMAFFFDFSGRFKILEKYTGPVYGNTSLTNPEDYYRWRNYVVDEPLTVGVFSLLVPIMLLILIVIFTTSSKYVTKSGRADKRYKNNPTTGPITNLGFLSISLIITGQNILALLMYLPALLFK